MKKTYIHPTTEVIHYNLCQPMLTTSVTLSETGTDIQFSREETLDLDDGNFFGFEEESPFDF